MRSLFCLLFLLANLWLYAQSEASYPIDITEAKEIVDATCYRDVEGIWEYPGDGIKVLVMKDPFADYQFSISVVESEDVRLKPGQLIGMLEESAEPEKYRMKLFTAVKHGQLAKLCDCVAHLKSDKDVMLVQAPKLKLNLGVSTGGLLLPDFWTRVRGTVRMSVDNPAANLPEGMRKVYPSYDGNGSSRHNPRVL